ncbi:MAG: hypothetical protein J6X28_01810 [Bacilli bacterium]|nr:hypothetical protein [Bacilli bacterium]
MPAGVSVNGPELLNTVSKTRENKDEFEKLYEEIYALVEKELDVDFSQEGKAWTGVKAGQFKTNFNNIKGDFILARDTIEKEATHLEDEVKTWTAFDA